MTNRIFSHFGPFFALLPPPYEPEKSKFWKMKKTPKDIIFYTGKSQMMIIWCIVPEIWRETDRIFIILDYFLPFYLPNNLENQNFEKWKKAHRYYHFTHVYHKWKLYDVWFLRYEALQTEFFLILDHFMPFYPLTT